MTELQTRNSELVEENRNLKRALIMRATTEKQ